MGERAGLAGAARRSPDKVGRSRPTNRLPGGSTLVGSSAGGAVGRGPSPAEACSVLAGSPAEACSVLA
ncbi:MAG: hypothetical protein ACRD0H_24475, partial [Actinomycetes bacterium]